MLIFRHIRVQKLCIRIDVICVVIMAALSMKLGGCVTTTQGQRDHTLADKI